MNHSTIAIRQFISALLLILIASTFFSSAQTTDKAVNGEITDLKFPYRKGYHLSYKGQVIQYDRYNFPEKTRPSLFNYYIADEIKDGDTWIVNFQFHQYTDTDTVSFDKTYLYIDEEGMFFWAENDPANVRNGVKEKVKEKKTHAIVLPLHAGDTWKSMAYNNQKADFECFTLDTVIETKKGSFHCFGVSQTNVIQKTKDYTYYSRSYDFYNQDIGKVAFGFSDYVVITSNSQRKRVSETSYVMEDYFRD